MNIGSEILTFVAGIFAGGIGALLGLGGGVFLIPSLMFGLGLTMTQASGVSVITIIATSSAASAAKGRLQLVNMRLGMVLEVFTTTGGVTGIWLFSRISPRTQEIAFACTLVAIGLMAISRLDKRNVVKDPNIDIGLLGGRFEEAESGGIVSYRVRRPIVAFVASFLAGVVSNFGIGGGVIKVPALNTWCGVPIRAAAATSSLMLAATALIVAADRFSHGQIIPELAAAGVLGVLAGTQAGLWMQSRSKAKTHKIILAVLMFSVAALYFFGLNK